MSQAEPSSDPSEPPLPSFSGQELTRPERRPPPVYIASRKKDQLEASVKELNALGKASGGSAAYIVADLKDKAGCEAVAKELKAKEAKLHVLINNTGCVRVAVLLLTSRVADMALLPFLR